MASQKISQLPAASTSSGSDLYTLVQGGVNKSITFTALQTAIALTPSSGITQLTGDVSAVGPGPATATVNSVGGQSSSAIATAAIAVSTSTSSDTASTLIKRDGSGNFSAGVITASLIGNVTGNVSGSSATFTNALLGDVTGTQSATTIVSTVVTSKLLTGFSAGPNAVVLATDSILIGFEKLQAQINNVDADAITALTGDVTATGPGMAAATVNSIDGQTAVAVAAATVEVNAATAVNSPSTLIKRDSSGNFDAGTISANLVGDVTGNVTGDLTGNVVGNVSGSSASFTGSLSGDVTGTQGATTITATVVTGKALTGYSVGANTPILATDTILSAFEKVQGQINNTDISAITALTGDVSASGPGSAAATVNSVGGKSASAVATAVTTVAAATNLDTPSTLVERDSSGNFSAGTITANLTGNASGSAGSFTGSLVGDITGTQGATVVSAIRGTTVSGTTGTGNVVFSASPTFTGTIVAASATFSGTVAINGSSIAALEVGSNVLTVDTVNGAIGINTAPSTAALIDVINSSGSTKAIQLTGYGSNVGVRGRYANGTLLAPTAATAGNTLEFIAGRGYGTSQFAVSSTGAFSIVAGETFTNTSNATYLTFSVTPTGSISNSEAMRLNSTGNLLVATTTDNGTDKLQVNGSASIVGNTKIATATTSVATLGASGSTAIHQFNGGTSYTNRTIAASTYTIDSSTTDRIVYTDSTSNPISITLPAPTSGRFLIVQDKTGQAQNNNVTIIPHTSQTINGLASVIIANAYGGYIFISDGTNWTFFANAYNASTAFAFGGGTDGNVTITTTVTLTRDMFYENLTISGVGKLIVGGYRIFVSGILNLTGAAAGAIQATGANGGAGAAAGNGGALGGAGTANTIGVGTVGVIGGAGGTAAGVEGATGTSPVAGQGGPSGAGSTGGTGTSGAGGAARPPVAILLGSPFTRFATDLLRAAVVYGGGGGAPGGSGGGGDGTSGAGGGGGGGAGGVIYLAANFIRTNGAAASSIQALGGNGGTGGSPAGGTRGAGGGGPGAGGGWIYLIYGTKLDTAASNVLDVSGGGSGSGGTGTNGANSGGASGGGGGGGRIDLFNMTTGTAVEVFGGTATTGNPASSVNSGGGSGVAGQVIQLNF